MKQLLKSNEIAKSVVIMNELWVINELREEVANSIYMKSLVAEYLEDPNCKPSDWIDGKNLTNFEKATFIYACNKHNDDYRYCDNCGDWNFTEGYVFRGGEAHACCDECRDAVCKNVYNTTWEEEYDEDGDSYYTEWED
jgi:hypothetical protein